MAKCFEAMYPAEIDGHFNLEWMVPESEAIHPFDAGSTVMLAITPERIRFEREGYESLGYTIVTSTHR